jgi:hypothetical protein
VLVGHIPPPALRVLTEDLVGEGPQLQGLGLVLVFLGITPVDPVGVLEGADLPPLLFEGYLLLPFPLSVSPLLLGMLLLALVSLSVESMLFILLSLLLRGPPRPLEGLLVSLLPPLVF